MICVYMSFDGHLMALEREVERERERKRERESDRERCLLILRRFFQKTCIAWFCVWYMCAISCAFQWPCLDVYACQLISFQKLALSHSTMIK